MSDISKGLRKASYTFIFGFIATVLGYLTRVFLARYTTMEDFGFLFATITTISFFTIFTNMGIGVAQTKFISHYKSKKENQKVATTIYFSLITRILLSLLLFFKT